MFYYGLYKNWPIGLVRYGHKCICSRVYAGMGHSPQEALGAVLYGVLFLMISLTPIRAWLINSIPKSLKLGIGAGIDYFSNINFK